MKRLLITGASGLLGSHVVLQAQGRFETLGVCGTYRVLLPGSFTQLNFLTDTDSLQQTVRQFQPNVIIHVAGMNSPLNCQRRRDEATYLNVEVTRQLACLAAELNARFLLISTDMVFDGFKGMYKETDPVKPIMHYANTKVLAEQVTAETVPNHMIIRSSLMVGESPRGDRSINEVLKLALGRGETIALCSDEFRSVIGARNLAEAIVEIADRTETGILHLGGPERRSRYDWGVLIGRYFGWGTFRIRPVRLADMNLSPPIPPDISLDISKAQQLLQTRIKTIQDVLRKI